MFFIMIVCTCANYHNKKLKLKLLVKSNINLLINYDINA